jgi:hypothetical protein
MSFFFLEKKEAKIQGSETMAKNYSFAATGQTRPPVFFMINCVLGSHRCPLAFCYAERRCTS